MLKKTRQHSLASWKILPLVQNILLHSFSHISVSLCTPKVWIIATSARFCLVSLPTRLLGGKSRSGRKNGAVAAKITELKARWSSYLSQISQIISVEKKLSCGEILGKFGKFWRNFGRFWENIRNFGRFCHNLRAFMWRKIEPEKYICGEKMTNMRSADDLYPKQLRFCCTKSLGSTFCLMFSHIVDVFKGCHACSVLRKIEWTALSFSWCFPSFSLKLFSFYTISKISI